VTSKTGWAIN